ncbi:glycoside hydrolase family 127 protein [Paenibacillus sp. AR247]|uniref:glycoside hydrolase family 127 protein n=1 Tax=Paenibacillus sp. AR247 TaxID=1631599 RepID=UPI000CFA2238|nr:beta-L-arabinofuranosidase domain-containing protein [Paenibacillus sp. AR247]PQP86959.1 hypothetical protein CPT76_28200 [Paenibacillus sp. AR247]
MTTTRSHQGWQGVPFTQVKIQDELWKQRLEVCKQVTLRTCLDKCESTGRISNFAKAAGLMEGEFEGIYFNDSDVYKVLEGAAYLLMADRDPELEAEIDRIIGLIAAAQEPDGYLTTYYTLEARNMYITGGIGPSRHNEGFTHDYDLPNESAYCETCASIAMVFWNHRMSLLFGEAKYADVVERAMYNGALAGISLSGDRFFYVNPLASQGDHHRTEWFDTSCCPTNLVRFLPSIGGYNYAVNEEGPVMLQFVAGTADLELKDGSRVLMKTVTRYPWDGHVHVEVEPAREAEFAVRLRLPGWCRGAKLSINGENVAPADWTIDRGFLVLSRRWKPGDTMDYVMEMPVQQVHARPEVEADRGRVAVQRGPLVYCLEQADNPELVYDEFAVRPGISFGLEPRDELGGMVALTGIDGQRQYRFVPYHLWDNREPGFMQVWLKEEEDGRLYSV